MNVRKEREWTTILQVKTLSQVWVRVRNTYYLDRRPSGQEILANPKFSKGRSRIWEMIVNGEICLTQSRQRVMDARSYSTNSLDLGQAYEYKKLCGLSILRFEEDESVYKNSGGKHSRTWESVNISDVWPLMGTIRLDVDPQIVETVESRILSESESLEMRICHEKTKF